MNAGEIYDRIKTRFPDAVVEFKADAVTEPFIVVQPESILEIARFVSTDHELKFDYLMSLSGVDFNDGNLGIVYHLFSMERRHRMVIKAKVAKDKAEIPSVEQIWKSANWHEREAFDLFGINFQGHPDLRRILLPDDWEGFPLRKDYKAQEYYRGMKVPY